MGASDDIDDRELKRLGIAREEVERQLALFRDPPGYADLVRACSVGDGIELLEDDVACLAAYDEARGAGRLSKFVPASGAASRMFQALLALRGRIAGRSQLDELRASGDPHAALAVEFLDGLDDFAFRSDLRAAVESGGIAWRQAVDECRFDVIVDALVATPGLGYAALPKGLIAFHEDDGRALTAFEEHLREAVELVRDDGGRARLHFTVSEEHLPWFQSKLGEIRPLLEGDGDTKLLVGFSSQQRSTDTVSVDLDNRPFRDADGNVVFRPGGHGALLENLNQSGADIVVVQNIDNIQPASRRADSLAWKKRLIGRLVVLEGLVAAALRGESLDPADEEVLRGLTPAASNGGMVAALDRPLRVCGVVRNTGEPGGGPFWVRAADGTVSKQIVEGAQVDSSAEDQLAMYETASHFNPALLACGLRRPDGRPFDLSEYVDPRAVFISQKSLDGRDLKALERPGLWNGSMAHWLTSFAEVGDAAFTPVKTIVDLLRPEHRS